MRKYFLAVLFLLAGAGAAAAADTRVEIRNFHFAMDVTVPAGTIVTWTNRDDEPHTVTSVDGQFRSPALDQDQSYSFRFEKPGIYRYVCSVHPQMTATVTVK